MLVDSENNLIFVQIKWICPTAPTRAVAAFGGFPCTACEFLNYVYDLVAKLPTLLS
jgi:hypothetical protein